jgi:hypothetical protein
LGNETYKIKGMDSILISFFDRIDRMNRIISTVSGRNREKVIRLSADMVAISLSN